jgi:hypothetical protein
MSLAIVTVAAGVVLGGLFLYRVWSAFTGTSWMGQPLVRVTRKDDPFSFWTSILPMVALAVVLAVVVLTRFAR